MKFLLSIQKDQAKILQISREAKTYSFDGGRIFTEGKGKSITSENKILYHDGYIRDLKLEINNYGFKSIIDALSGNWPLPLNITGSFSSLLIDEEQEYFVLSTDLIGLYPLYYSNNEDGFFVSNSIIWMGLATGAEVDEAGVVQRCLGPLGENFGSRTILKNCKRLLPGECLRFDFKGQLISKKYDNSLYKNMTSPHQEHALWEEYWKSYQREVSYCTNYSAQVNVALSGGIDSRLALGAIPEGKKITCYTFGKPENYESKVAKKLAKIKGADFVSCWNPEVYFPDKKTLEDYTYNTEGVQLCSWLEITESVPEYKREPLLLGELCEALPGRKIEKFSSKQFRQENFRKYYIENEDYSFTPTTKKNFEDWKEKILKQYKRYYHEVPLNRLVLKSSKEELILALESDLQQIFERIEVHQLPYEELFDELFSWYTYTRLRLSKQLLVAGSKFEAYSPAMSLQMLRKTSSLHPNLRLNYRFARNLFMKDTKLKKLYRVPTSQAPIIPQTAPDLLKFLVWGARSKADQFLINRLMKKKNAKARFRVFPSINWAMVYQHPKMSENLNDYFKHNHLGEIYTEKIKEMAESRKGLKQWPFANMDIINVASLNMELELMQRKEN